MDDNAALCNIEPTQIESFLEGVAGAAIGDWEAEPVSPSSEGGGLYRFRYRALAGFHGEVAVFVKRCKGQARAEAAHYRHFAKEGVPTPTLYAALHNADGEETLFLEPLTSAGFHAHNEYEWRQFLSLMAKVNACPVVAGYAPCLHQYEQAGVIEGGMWLLGLNPNPSAREVEESLKASGAPHSEISLMAEAAQTLFSRVTIQPCGLLHQDFLPDNVGWRGERDAIVVFDLHKNAWGPRFADVAPYLGTPDWSSRSEYLDDVEAEALSRREVLTRHYLNEYARFGGESVSLDTFQSEAADLIWAHKASSLWRLSPTRIEEVLAYLRQLAFTPPSA